MATYVQSLVPSEHPKTGTVWVWRGRADFKKLAEEIGRAAQASDSVVIGTIPAKTTLIGGNISSPRVEGGTLTIDTGTTAAGNEIDDAFNANANTTPLKFDTKPFTSADTIYNLASGATIYITPKNAADTAIIDVQLYCVTHTDAFVTP